MNAIQGDIHDRDPVAPAVAAAPQSNEFVQVVDADSSTWIRRTSIIAVDSQRTIGPVARIRVFLSGSEGPIRLTFDTLAQRDKAVALLVNPLIP